MQQEDDLRGLAKVMEFMRAISIIFVVINIYWFCYFALHEWGIIIGVVDKILLNFDRTAGLFGNILYTKLFAVVFLALSCLGTKGVKEENHLAENLCFSDNRFYPVLYELSGYSTCHCPQQRQRVFIFSQWQQAIYFFWWADYG